MKKKVILLTTLLSFLASCNPTLSGFESRDEMPEGEGIFSILDNYPSLKQAFSKLDEKNFNDQLKQSLGYDNKKILDFLSFFNELITSKDSSFQHFMSKTGDVLGQIATVDREALETLDNLISKFQKRSKYLLKDSTNIAGNSLNYLIEQKPEKINLLFNDLLNYLSSNKSKSNLKELENTLLKFTSPHKNPKLHKITKTLLVGFSEFTRDPINKKILENLLDEFLKIFVSRTKSIGKDPGLGLAKILKKLLLNLNQHFTLHGRYNHPGSKHPITLKNLFFNPNPNFRVPSLFESIKKIASTKESQNSTTLLLELFSKALYKINFNAFDSNTTSIEDSLYKFLTHDSNLEERSPDKKGISTQEKPPNKKISALESALLASVLGNSFGFKFDNSNDINTSGPIQNRVMTLGDGLHSIGISSWIANILPGNKSNIYKDGSPLSFDANTPAIDFFQGESLGVADKNKFPKNHSKNFINWAISWIVLATWKGYAPYYNKNKQDRAGNYLSPDGLIQVHPSGNYKNYRSTWETSTYCYDEVPLGFQDEECMNEGTNNTGGRYTIKEVKFNKPSSTWHCESDIDCIYKNFDWLLYEKRFVIVQPIQGKVFSTIIGNGLISLLELRLKDDVPFGKWKKAKISLKNQDADDLDNFSDKPADYVFLTEKYKSPPKKNLTFWERFKKNFELTKEFFREKIYRFKAQGYGGSEVLRQQGNIIRYLGHTSKGKKPFSSWEESQHKKERNALLPVAVALLAPWFNKVDTSKNENIYLESIQALEPLLYPRVYAKLDQSKQRDNYYLIPQIQGDNSKWRDPINNGTNSNNFLPNENYRSILSFLIDTTPYQADGILSLVTQTKFLSYFIEFLKKLGSPKYDNPAVFNSSDVSTWGTRGKIFYAISEYLKELKLESDNPTPNQINFEKVIGDSDPSKCDPPKGKIAGIECWLVKIGRNSDQSWEKYKILIDVTSTALGSNARYSSRTEFHTIIDAITTPLEEKEIDSILKVFTHILYDSSKNKSRYDITDFMTNHLPLVMKILNGDYNTLYLLSRLMKSKGFSSYFLSNAKSDYPLENILKDLQGFFNSKTMQDTSLISFWGRMYEIIDKFKLLLASKRSRISAFEDYLPENHSTQDWNPYFRLGRLLEKEF